MNCSPNMTLTSLKKVLVLRNDTMVGAGEIPFFHVAHTIKSTQQWIFGYALVHALALTLILCTHLLLFLLLLLLLHSSLSLDVLHFCSLFICYFLACSHSFSFLQLLLFISLLSFRLLLFHLHSFCLRLIRLHSFCLRLICLHSFCLLSSFLLLQLFHTLIHDVLHSFSHLFCCLLLSLLFHLFCVPALALALVSHSISCLLLLILLSFC